MQSEEFKLKVDRIMKGLDLAYEEMLKFKKYKGTPVVLSENGKIKHIPSDEIPPTTKYHKS